MKGLLLALCLSSSTIFAQELSIVNVTGVEKYQNDYSENIVFILLDAENSGASFVMDLRKRTCLVSLDWDLGTRYFDAINEEKCLSIYDMVTAFSESQNQQIQISYIKEESHLNALLRNITLIENGEFKEAINLDITNN